MRTVFKRASLLTATAATYRWTTTPRSKLRLLRVLYFNSSMDEPMSAKGYIALLPPVGEIGALAPALHPSHRESHTTAKRAFTLRFIVLLVVSRYRRKLVLVAAR